MPENLTRIPLTFEKGVRQDLDDSVIPPGYAAEIVNWVPLPTGGLRPRQGWRTGTTGGDGPPASVRLIGMGLQAALGKFVWINFDAASSVYRVYMLDTDDPGSDNNLQDTINIATEGEVSVAMGRFMLAFGSPHMANFHGVDQAGGNIDSAGNAVPQHVMALEYHLNRFWAGGGERPDGTAAPVRLFYTDTGDGAMGSWPSANWIDVDLAGGGKINALCTHQDSLIIGKNSALHILQGDPSDALDLQRLDAGNAMPGNSIVSTPYGVLIVGYDDVYLYDGAVVNRIGGPIKGSFLAAGDTLSGPFWADVAFFDDKAYVTGAPFAARTVWVYDFQTKAWFTEESLTTGTHVRRLLTYRLGGIETMVGGIDNGSVGGNGLLFRKREIPATYVPDLGGAQSYLLRTPEYWTGPATIRHLDLRLRQRGGSPAETGLTVTATIRQGNGTTKQAVYIVDPRNPGVWAEQVDLPGPGFAVSFEVSQDLLAGQSSVMDVEEAVLSFAGEPPR